MEWEWGLNKGRVYAGFSVYSVSPQTWWAGSDVSLVGWGTLLCEVRGPFLPTTEPHFLKVQLINLEASLLSALKGHLPCQHRHINTHRDTEAEPHSAPIPTNPHVPAHAPHMRTHVHRCSHALTRRHAQTRTQTLTRSPSHPCTQTPAHTYHTVPILGQEGAGGPWSGSQLSLHLALRVRFEV